MVLEQGACFSAYPEVDMITPADFYQADRLIKRFCNHCPVVSECGSLALAEPAYLVGIWGGVYLPQVHGNARVRKARREGLAALKLRCATLEESVA